MRWPRWHAPGLSQRRHSRHPLSQSSRAHADDAAPSPPSNLEDSDRKDDAGDALVRRWTQSDDDVPEAEPRKVQKYEIFRKTLPDGGFVEIGEEPYGTTDFIDANCKPGEKYLYQITAVALQGSRSTSIATEEPVMPVTQWFNRKRTGLAVLLIVICGAVIYFTESARSGRDLKMRKIPGLEAVDEAVGRSIEMGRPCLFVPGVMDINDIQTVAGLTVLSRVAQTAAEYHADVEVPTSRSLVMTAAREAVQAAYATAGNPEGTTRAGFITSPTNSSDMPPRWPERWSEKSRWPVFTWGTFMPSPCSWPRPATPSARFKSPARRSHRNCRFLSRPATTH